MIRLDGRSKIAGSLPQTRTRLYHALFSSSSSLLHSYHLHLHPSSFSIFCLSLPCGSSTSLITYCPALIQTLVESLLHIHSLFIIHPFFQMLSLAARCRLGSGLLLFQTPHSFSSSSISIMIFSFFISSPSHSHSSYTTTSVMD